MNDPGIRRTMLALRQLRSVHEPERSGLQHGRLGLLRLLAAHQQGQGVRLTADEVEALFVYDFGMQMEDTATTVTDQVLEAEPLSPDQARELAGRLRDAAARLRRAADEADRHAQRVAVQEALEVELQALQVDGWETHRTAGKAGVLAVVVSPKGEHFVLQPNRIREGMKPIVRLPDSSLRVRYYRERTRVRVAGGRVAHTVTRESPQWCVRCSTYVGAGGGWALHLASEDLRDCKMPHRRVVRAPRQLRLGETDD